MRYNDHSELRANKAHAFLSPSKYHWVNYDDDKFIATYKRAQAARLGTALHEFAETCIRLSQKLPRSKKTLNQFVNDAIGFRMEPELLVYFSENSFGTADALSFRDGVLRIHDLKTGVSRASFKQLELYAALFCLEYGLKPPDIDIKLRIYQNDSVEQMAADNRVISALMRKIVHFDALINTINADQ